MKAAMGVWTWGVGVCLGHTVLQNKHVPTLLPGAVFEGGKVVMVAAGGKSHRGGDEQGGAAGLG